MNNQNESSSIFILALSSLIGALFVFFTQVLLARILSPFEFGVWSSSFAMVTLLTPLAGFGIASFWLKVFGKEGLYAFRWIPGSIKYMVFSSILTLLLIVFWAIFGPHGSLTTNILLIMTLYAIGQLSLDCISSKWQLESKYIKLAILQFTPHFVRFILIAILVITATYKIDVENVAYIYSFVALIIFFIGLIILFKSYSGKEYGHIRKNKKYKKLELPGINKIAIKVWPFGLAGIFYLIYFQSDIILLRYLSGPESSGIYNIAFLIIAAVYLIPSIINQKYLLPKLHRWAYHDRKRFFTTYRTNSLIMLVSGLIAMIFLWIFSSLIISLLFGEKYQNATLLVIILSFAVPMRFVSIGAGVVLMTQNNIQKKVKYMSIAAICNIILNLALIPYFYEIGAAVTTVISELILLLLYINSVNKYIFSTNTQKGD